MNRIAAVACCLIVLAARSTAGTPDHEADPIRVRTGSHPGFIRIVIEGSQSLLSRAGAERHGRDVIVSFRGSPFTAQDQDLPDYCRKEEESIRCSPKHSGRVKSFTLKNPDRFVLDIYREVAKKEVSMGEDEAVAAPEKGIDEEVIASEPDPGIASRETAGSSDTKSRAEKREEKDFIPEHYRGIWALLETGNFYAVIKELPSFRPRDTPSMAAYYYLYGRANIMAKQYLDAAKHFRLAYIYAEEGLFKERILMARADTYMRLGFYQEAQADYIVFFRNYPASAFVEAAHFGLAQCLAAIGKYREAVEQYEMAGSHPEILFGKANALQRLERPAEAKDVYAEAMALDRTYPDSSPETYYLMGENMRMTGDIYNAKIHLARIDSGPFYHNALMSAGLIALEQSILEEAVRKFRAAAASPVQKVRVQALFNLSLAHARQGAFSDAIASLEEIRNNHIDSSMYKDTLLVLAKLYKKEGRVEAGLSLLKELVYGVRPPAEAFEELEKIVLERLADTADEAAFLRIWAEVGTWLTDPQREDFLLKVADGLRHAGRPYIELCLWLMDNGSVSARGRAAAGLAEYYTAVGSDELARKYITEARDFGERGDGILRAESRMLLTESRPEEALKKLLRIRTVTAEDLGLLGAAIAAAAEPDSQEVRDAMVFYEDRMIEGRWDAEHYTALADMFYDRGEYRKSRTYYQMALNREPANQWALYRMGRITGMPESQELFSRLEKENSLLGSLAKSKLLELALMEKVKEVY